MKLVIAAFAGSIVCLVTGTIIAILMQPYIAPHFGTHIRTEEQGLLFPALLAGYFVIGATLTWVAMLTDASAKSWPWVLQTGAALGLAIFLGDHLITAGWSQLAAIPMTISGTLDALSIVASFCAIALVLKRRSVIR
ncbi:MAG TPA: hypothetical protein VKA18_02140 [Alphaproteobacteria bacterium]|nr:hypothetical protein [Alphaproteobacteria bacterium]